MEQVIAISTGLVSFVLLSSEASHEKKGDVGQIKMSGFFVVVLLFFIIVFKWLIDFEEQNAFHLKSLRVLWRRSF